MNISLKDINRYIDAKGTKALYAALDNHGKENAAAYNFAQNIAMRERNTLMLSGLIRICFRSFMLKVQTLPSRQSYTGGLSAEVFQQRGSASIYPLPE